MAQQNIKQKATAGMVWTAFQKYSQMIISFISGIVLARLLDPKDYGCIGMLSIFMTLAETVIDGGFGSALIQKKRPSQEDYSTIFFWNLGMAAIMYIILFFSAPAISRFYNIELLSPVLRVQALVLFIYAFNLIQRNQLRKNLNFKILSIITITTSIISLGVTIYMAYKGFGVWALVAQNLISAAIPAIVFWFYIKWRPIWVFSKNSFKELFSFGFYMFLTHLLNTLSNKINGLFIGKLYNPATMGYFSKAEGTEKLASTSISSIMTQVTYPLYASIQDDKQQLTNMLRRLVMTVSYVTTPLMLILALTAKPIFVILYSDKWLASVPYFQVLCIAGLAFCLQSVNNQTLAAIGKSKEMFLWTIVKRGVGLTLKIVGIIYWGMNGLMVAMVIGTWFAYFINVANVSKYVGYKNTEQLKDLLPSLAVGLIAAGTSYFLGYIFKLNMYLDGGMKLLVFLCIYLGWSFIFKPESYTYTLTIIPTKFRFWERKRK